MKLRFLKLKISFIAITRVLARPAYSFLFIVLSILTLAVFLWVFNINLLLYIATSSNLSFVEKLSFFVGSFESIVTNFDSLGAATLLVFSTLFGLNITVLIYLIKSRSRTGKAGTKSGISAVAAAIGAGCAACGTSILTPVIASVGAASVAGVARTIGIVANVIGITLVLWSLYGLGKQAASVQAAERLSK